MSQIVMDKMELNLVLDRMAANIAQKYPVANELALVGIQRRGFDLARRLANILREKHDMNVACGALDINLYRDDWTRIAGNTPHVGKSHIPFPMDDKNILLVDDVLFSGRTIRAALEAILDYGRPQSVHLAVLIDRGHRELPITADYAGKTISTDKQQHVDVMLEERDGQDAVILN